MNRVTLVILIRTGVYSAVFHDSQSQETAKDKFIISVNVLVEPGNSFTLSCRV